MKFVLLLILIGMVTPVFAQEISFDDQFVSSEEYTKLMERLHALENKSYFIESFAIGISLLAVVVSSIIGFKGRSLSKKYHGFEARQKIDDTVNSLEINLAKREVVKEYWNLDDINKTKEIENPKIIFTNSPEHIKDKVLQLENAFNIVCSWYQNDKWVDTNDFENVIGGYICNTWDLLKDEIIHHQKNTDNTNFCKHFQEVAKEFYKMSHIKKVPLYRMDKFKNS